VSQSPSGGAILPEGQHMKSYKNKVNQGSSRLFGVRAGPVAGVPGGCTQVVGVEWASRKPLGLVRLC
jgi:hypothetical protein